MATHKCGARRCIGILLFFCAFAGPYLGLFENTNKLQAAETIKIAAILPLTGKAATYGRAALEGVEVAVDSLNGAGGLLDRSLELIVIDNTSTPLGSRQAAKKAVGLNVSAVIGAVWSTHSLAMAPVLQEAGIPMISPGSTAPQVTHAGSYIFRTCYTDSFQGRLLAGFAYHELQARTAAILTNLNETYSQELSSQFDSAFRQIGGKVVMADGYKGSAVDFKTMLQSVKARSPDVVFIPGYSKDSGFIIRQAHAMKLRALFLGGDAWETDIAEFAGPRLEGSYFSTFWHPNLSSPESRHFTTTFHAYHGKREISPYAALAYDAVYLFAHAVDHAGSLKRQDIREELQGTKGFNGATGAFTFDEFGDPLDKGAAILKFVKGQWVLYKWVGPTAWQTNMVR